MTRPMTITGHRLGFNSFLSSPGGTRYSSSLQSSCQSPDCLGVFESLNPTMQAAPAVYYVPAGQAPAMGWDSRAQDFFEGFLQLVAGSVVLAFLFGLLSTNSSKGMHNRKVNDMEST